MLLLISPLVRQKSALESGVESTTPVRPRNPRPDKTCALCEAFEHDEICSILGNRRQCCQPPQRLLKTGHRHDPDPIRVAARLGGVFPSRNEEDLDPGAFHPDRLLLDAADLADRPVELERTG